MEKIDARKLSTEAQEQLRRQAVRLRKRGDSYKSIGEIVGVHPQTVSRWWQKYEKEGAKGLKIERRGRREGEKRTLSPVQEIIKRQFSIKMPIRTVGEYLSRWGFTPQKPLKQAYEQRPAAVEKWLKEDYIEMLQKAKTEGAEIHWGDECGIRSDSQHGRSYAPKGKTPVIHLSAKRSSINMISSITNQGKVRFMVYKEKMTAQVLIKFLKQLIKGSRKKIYLVLDNLRVHHAKLVKAWLLERPEEIELYYLPSYSPELNPDEYLNCDLKAGVHSKPPSRTQDHLVKKVRSHMIKLQKRPARVRSYFQHRKISYAA